MNGLLSSQMEQGNWQREWRLDRKYISFCGCVGALLMLGTLENTLKVFPRTSRVGSGRWVVCFERSTYMILWDMFWAMIKRLTMNRCDSG